MNSNATESNRSLTLIFVIILVIPGLLYQTTLAMANVWLVNETFTHGFLIFPITLWLIWIKKDHLAKLPPAPEPLALIATLLMASLWLVSALIDIKVIMQLSMISMILTVVWAVLGRKIFIYLLFPFMFLYLAVPLGQGLIPPALMDFTANTTVSMIRLTGIPIYQDGLNFILPSGSWSVIEECSGVRYLIATLTLGTVYAYLNYATLKKRLIFIAFSIIIPILTNSLRAYIIVLLGHYSGMKLAIGADHLIYGWVLFGIIIFAMFYIGSFWRDNKDDFDKNAPAPKTHQLKPYAIHYLTISLVLISLFQFLFYQLHPQTVDSRLTANAIPRINKYGSWHLQSINTSTWNPIFHQPDLVLSDTYNSTQDNVQLDIGYFHTQRSGSETVSSRNKLVNPYKGTWRIISSSVFNTDHFPVCETVIALANQKLLTWQWYRMGESQTCNPYKAKLYEAYTRLFSDRTDGAFITLSTPLNEDKKTARIKLLSFFDEAIDDINRQLDNLQENIQENDK